MSQFFPLDIFRTIVLSWSDLNFKKEGSTHHGTCQMYHLDCQVFTYFGIVNPLFIYKIVDKSMKFLPREGELKFLGISAILYLQNKTKLNKNLTVQVVLHMSNVHT
jgi:hypothetical protein